MPAANAEGRLSWFISGGGQGVGREADYYDDGNEGNNAPSARRLATDELAFDSDLVRHDYTPLESLLAVSGPQAPRGEDAPGLFRSQCTHLVKVDRSNVLRPLNKRVVVLGRKADCALICMFLDDEVRIPNLHIV